MPEPWLTVTHHVPKDEDGTTAHITRGKCWCKPDWIPEGKVLHIVHREIDDIIVAENF